MTHTVVSSRRTPSPITLRDRFAAEPLEARRLLATVPSGFSDFPFGDSFTSGTSMAFAPDGRLFALSQGGTVRVFANTGATLATLTPVSTTSSGERGLLGIAFDPSFASNNYVYLYYTTTSGGTHNRVSRFTVGGTSTAPTLGGEQVIVDLENLSTATNHNGGALAFGPDGKLYVAVGDNANAANAQSITSRFGKILRYNPDGSIPADNPTSIAGIAGTPTGVYRAIWAAGLRNPYTFAFNPINGQMLINDVGEGTWEEVNVGAAGRNYGWNATEGYFTPGGSTANFTPPLYAYQHGSGLQKGFAITGGAFYTHTSASAFPQQYQNKYFFGEYVSDWVGVLNPAAAPQAYPASTAPNFASGAGGVVDLDVGPDGALYYLSRETIGGAAQGVRRIVWTPSAARTITLATSGFGSYGTTSFPATSLLLDYGTISTGDATAQMYSETVAVGTTRTFQAPATQTFNGQTYQFQTWSDGVTTAKREVVMPNLNTTYTAVYKDVTAPTVTATAFTRGRATPSSPPHQLAFTFSEGVKAQGTTLTLLNQTTGQTTTVNTLPTLSADAKTVQYTFAGLFADGELPNGRYTATLGSNGVKDLAGNANAQVTFNFVVLRADTDSDGDVDFADLLTLAKNYNGTGKTFAQGNVDMSADGSVNFADLLLLAKNYNTTLPSGAAPDALAAASTPTRKRASAAEGIIV